MPTTTTTTESTTHVQVTIEDLKDMLTKSRWSGHETKGDLEATLDNIRDTLRFILHDSGAMIDPDIAQNDGDETND